jgi:energy-coupling factor transporter transmembrane protein EcfT
MKATILSLIIIIVGPYPFYFIGIIAGITTGDGYVTKSISILGTFYYLGFISIFGIGILHIIGKVSEKDSFELMSIVAEFMLLIRKQ